MAPFSKHAAGKIDEKKKISIGYGICLKPEILNLKKGGGNYESKIIMDRCGCFMSDTMADYGSGRRLVTKRFD
jgi:hypothetical protein